MKSFVIKRLLQLIPVLFGITFFTFMLTYLSPGDPAELMLNATGVTPTTQLVQQVREDLGLNRPFMIQYFDWLRGIVKGDFGTSYKYGKPVLSLILSRLPATFELAAAALIIMLIIAIPFGIISSVYKNKPLDYIIRFLSFIGLSMPGFWIGLLLMYVFAVKLKILPIIGNSSWQGMIMPVLTLTIAMAAKYTRQLRAVILEELNQKYVLGVKARGIRERVILIRHVLQNSLVSIITLLGMSLGSLLGGTAIVETIFVYQGVGKLAVDAIFSRDYPLIQGYVVWMAIIYVVINIVVDISYTILDPRIRIGKRV